VSAAPRLVVFFARVGDLVMLTPFLRACAVRGPVELLARPWARPLLGRQPWLADIHTLAQPNAAGWKDWLAGGPRRELGAQLVARSYREVLTFADRPVVRRWIDGWRGAVPVRELTLTGFASGTHTSDQFLAAGRAAGLVDDGDEPCPRLDVDADALATAQATVTGLGRRVVAIQAGSSLTNRFFRRRPNLKGLPPATWAAFAGGLLDQGRADAVVLLGTAAERGEAQAIIASADPRHRPRLHDRTGAVPLGQLAAFLAACSGCASVDTGPAHIAAAVGCPLLTVFGPSDPALYAPRGTGPCALAVGSASCQFCLGTPAFKRCRDNICLRPVTAEVLLRAMPDPAPR